MPDKAHVEEYFKTEQKRDNRTIAGWRIEEVRYYRVVAEKTNRHRRVTVREEFTNSAMAKAYSDGWNKCLEIAQQEINQNEIERLA